MAQVQGQMEICNKSFVDFVSWHATGGFVVLRVFRSRQYWDWLLPQLLAFVGCLDSGQESPPRRHANARPPPPAVQVELLLCALRDN
jgi:hypothetical protein